MEILSVDKIRIKCKYGKFLSINNKKNSINIMGLDNRTVAMYGWEVEGRDNVDKFQKDLEDWKEDYWNDIETFIIEDTMCGEYIYFGLELVYYDANEGGSEVITKKLIQEKLKYWNVYMEGNPALNEIFNKYKNGEPQLYILNHIY